MAFDSVTTMRTARLNIELGLSSDADNRFGTTAERDFAIQDSIRKLWPQCARLTRESVTVVLGQTDYPLVTIRDVVGIELVDSTVTPNRVTQDYRNYRAWVDEAAEPATARLTLGEPLATTYTIRVIGYAAYLVPALAATLTDIPLLMEPIITAGARGILYWRRLNQFVDFERRQNTNTSTQVTPEQMLAMATAADREYQMGKVLWQRGLSVPKRAIFQR